jgi:beta-galactosidase
MHIKHHGVFVSPQIRDEIRCNHSQQNNSGGGECTTDLAAVTTQVEVANGRSSNATFSVTVVLHAPSGVEVGSASSSVQSINQGATAVVRLVVVVRNASLWSVDAPHLYTMVTTLSDPAGLAAGSNVNIVAATVVDRVSTPFGVRKVRWSPDSGMWLNDQRVRLNGFANHQDLGGLGTAVPDPLQVYRVQTMKELGANAWRCAHNPPNPALVNAMDRLGMLVRCSFWLAFHHRFCFG